MFGCFGECNTYFLFLKMFSFFEYQYQLNDKNWKPTIYTRIIT